MADNNLMHQEGFREIEIADCGYNLSFQSSWKKNKQDKRTFHEYRED
jgi:hypothetical protein